jgi:SPP1 gp7 family putative phage head morphogenesis protein
MPPSKHLPRRLLSAYIKNIYKIVGRVLPPKVKEQSFDDWLKDIAVRSQRKDIQDAAKTLAKRMVAQVNVINARTWREAASRSQKSRKLYALLRGELDNTALGRRVNALVEENAKYISSIALEQATVLANEIVKATQRGARPATIAKMARNRFPALIKSRVNLIARTETAKASSALTQARSEDVGAFCYEWLSSEDVRVRKSHRKMNNVIVAWDDSPSPEDLVGEKSGLGHYHAGACPNCRCTSAPVLHPDDLSWPRRVYRHGSITQMNKQQFLASFGLLKAA